VIQLRGKGYRVRLVSDRVYLYVYPLAIWIPTGAIEFQDIAIPLKDLASVHGFELIVDKVVRIDMGSKKVALQSRELAFDSMIIAMGGGENKTAGDRAYLFHLRFAGRRPEVQGQTGRSGRKRKGKGCHRVRWKPQGPFRGAGRAGLRVHVQPFTLSRKKKDTGRV